MVSGRLTGLAISAYWGRISGQSRATGRPATGKFTDSSAVFSRRGPDPKPAAVRFLEIPGDFVDKAAPALRRASLSGMFGHVPDPQGDLSRCRPRHPVPARHQG